MVGADQCGQNPDRVAIYVISQLINYYFSEITSATAMFFKMASVCFELGEPMKIYYC